MPIFIAESLTCRDFSRVFTSAASTSTLTAWPIKSTDSTSRACAPLRISRPTTPFSGPDPPYHLAFLDERARIVRQLALDQLSDALDLLAGMGDGMPSLPTICTTPSQFEHRHAVHAGRTARSSSRGTAATRSSSCDPSSGSTSRWSAGRPRSTFRPAGRDRSSRDASASRCAYHWTSATAISALTGLWRAWLACCRPTS